MVDSIHSSTRTYSVTSSQGSRVETWTSTVVSTSHRTRRSENFRSTANRGNRNVQVRMAISIKEAMMKNEKTINYKLPIGRDEFATVKIPAGVQHGVTFKFAGMGDDSIKNVPRGDLMVMMSVLDSDGYTRKGNDLYTDKTIDCFQAVSGHEFNLRHWRTV